jgi:hypothetical protein
VAPKSIKPLLERVKAKEKKRITAASDIRFTQALINQENEKPRHESSKKDAGLAELTALSAESRARNIELQKEKERLSAGLAHVNTKLSKSQGKLHITTSDCKSLQVEHSKVLQKGIAQSP